MKKGRPAMTNIAKRSRKKSASAGRVLDAGEDARFAEVLALIESARSRAYQAVNSELVTLYWQLGEHISRKVTSAEWGDGVVDELALTLAGRFPGLRGFTRRNLFRMRQFYEAYRGQEKVSPLLTQLPWTHHLIPGPGEAAGEPRVLHHRDDPMTKLGGHRGDSANGRRNWRVASRPLRAMSSV